MPNRVASLPEVVAEKLSRGEITRAEAGTFLKHVRRVEREIYAHEVIHRNPYTKWFKQGEANTDQLKDLVMQFSVFRTISYPSRPNEW